MTYRDRNGELFEGTAAELRKHNDKLRKREYRKGVGRTVVLPLKPSTSDALQRLQARFGFEDPRELISQVVHRLDELADCPEIEPLFKWDRPPLDLNKYLPLIGGDVKDDEDRYDPNADD